MTSGKTNVNSNKVPQPPHHMSGKGHHPHKHPLYTGPLVRTMNQSKMFVNVGANISLAIEVCSNPRAHKIFWLAPNFRSLKIGGGEGGGRSKDIKVDNLVAKKVVPSAIRVTCVHTDLYITNIARKDEGEYILVAKNRYGFDGASIVLKVIGGARKRQRKNERDRTASISRKRNSDKALSPTNTSISIKSASVVKITISVALIITYCFLVVGL